MVTPENPVGIGIVGCGVIAQQHLMAAQANPCARIAAVCDIRADVAEKAAAAFGAAKVYTDAAALIADADVHLVILALPTAFRTALGLAVLGAGKHLLTEKPVAMNTREVDQLIAARGDGIFAACCSSRVSGSGAVAAARNWIAAGNAGVLRVLRCRHIMPAGKVPQNPPPAWRLKHAANGGGIFVNWGCYDLDFLFAMVGWKVEPVEVFAQTFTMPPIYHAHQSPDSDAEVHMLCTVRFAGGAVLQYERAERATTVEMAEWAVVGDRGGIRAHILGHQSKVFADSADEAEGTRTTTLYHEPQSPYNWHAFPLDDLLAAIRDGRAPATSLERARIIAQITDGAYASAASGRSVTLAQ